MAQTDSSGTTTEPRYGGYTRFELELEVRTIHHLLSNDRLSSVPAQTHSCV